MNFLWILFAFVCGFGARVLGQPPLIGYLGAGFLLNAIGVESDATLDTLSNLGITLMLFTIGLKLHVRDLLQREVWAGSLGHMGVWMLVAPGLAFGLAALGLPYLTSLDARTAALLAFALSFSSTVCVIQILEDGGEVNSRHGRLAVGILVIQDIVAVVFLAVATGEAPTPWAFLLLGLVFARPLLGTVLGRSGHGEMLPLTGFLLALGGYELFTLVGVKGDLGALVLGTLLSGHPKASELAKSLLGFKDLFLIGFFLSIGLIALPDAAMVVTAFALCLLLPLKALLFFFFFTRLQLRGRTSFLATLALGNYSEFGLIVMFLCVEAGWLGGEWLVILALAVSISFVLTSTTYRSAHALYTRWKTRIRRYENSERLPVDQVYRPSSAEILVVGTGRVGRGAYRALHDQVGDRVWGMDADRDLIARQCAAGMHVFAGDAENADLWDAIDVASIQLVLIAVPSVQDCCNITQQLRLASYKGPIAAIARFEDEREILLAAGIDKVFNFYTEAGIAFADDSLLLIDEPRLRPAEV
ncbi:MAG: glutathione-regulated potassium-efflux system ancillary protein KefC [Planctomycetota bacterium]|jgi:glutathione-regulated potassium-efflux system ancillary protein KefC